MVTSKMDNNNLDDEKSSYSPRTPKKMDPKLLANACFERHGANIGSREELAEKLMEMGIKNRNVNQEIINQKIKNTALTQAEQKLKESERLLMEYKNETEKLKHKLCEKDMEIRKREDAATCKIQASNDRLYDVMTRLDDATKKSEALNDKIEGLNSHKVQLESLTLQLKHQVKECDLTLKQMDTKFNVVNREKLKLLKACNVNATATAKIKAMEKQIILLTRIESLVPEFCAQLSKQPKTQKTKRLVLKFLRLQQALGKSPEDVGLLQFDTSDVEHYEDVTDGDDVIEEEPHTSIDDIRQEWTAKPHQPIKPSKVVASPVSTPAVKSQVVGAKKNKCGSIDPRASATAPDAILNQPPLHPIQRQLAFTFSRELRQEVDVSRKIAPLLRPPVLATVLPRRRAPGVSSSQFIAPSRISSRSSKAAAPIVSPPINSLVIVSQTVRSLVDSVVAEIDGRRDIPEPPHPQIPVAPKSIPNFVPCKPVPVVVPREAPPPMGVPGVKSRIIGTASTVARKIVTAPPPSAIKSNLDLSSLINDMQMGKTHLSPVKKKVDRVKLVKQNEEKKGKDTESDDSVDGLVIDDSVPKEVTITAPPVPINIPVESPQNEGISQEEEKVTPRKRGRPRKRNFEGLGDDVKKKPKEKKLKEGKRDLNESAGANSLSPKPVRLSGRTKCAAAAFAAKLPSGISLVPMGASHHTRVASKRAVTAVACSSDDAVCDKSIFSILELLNSAGPEKLSAQLNAALENETLLSASQALSRYICFGLAPKCGDMLARLVIGDPPAAPFMADIEHRFFDVINHLKHVNGDKWTDIVPMVATYLYPKCFQLSSHNPPQFMSALRCFIAISKLGHEPSECTVEGCMQMLLSTRPSEIVVPAFVFICAVAPELFTNAFLNLPTNHRSAFSFHLTKYSGKLCNKSRQLLEHYAPAIETSAFDPPNCDIQIRLAKMKYLNTNPIFVNEPRLGLSAGAVGALANVHLILNSVETTVADELLDRCLDDVIRDITSQPISQDPLAAQIILFAELARRQHTISSKKLRDLLRECVKVMQSPDLPCLKFSIEYLSSTLVWFAHIKPQIKPLLNRICSAL